MHLSGKMSRFAVLALLALTACDALTGPPNRAPMAGQIPAQTVHVGERLDLDLAGYFTDPDGDSLTFAAESGHPGLVAAEVQGAMLELAALLQGAATVEVTATDSEGLTASSHVDVVIPNRAPVVSETLADQTLTDPPNDSVFVILSGYFDDPDGDALTFTAESADTAVVRASVVVSLLTLAIGGEGGETRVMVTATDPAEEAVSSSFAVAVNRAPVVAEIPAQTVIAETPALVLDLARYASDPDGDALTFTAESADTAAVAVSLSAAMLTVSAVGVRQAEAQVTVTVRDPDGLAAAASFGVVVRENPDRATLEAFFHATDGPNWPNNYLWGTDFPMTRWHGIGLNEEGRVVCFGWRPCWDASTKWAVERLTPELGDLDALEILGLHVLSTSPVPPAIGNLASLRVLRISGRVDGGMPRDLGNLANLDTLDWYTIRTTVGRIPPKLGNLSSLRYLRVVGDLIGIPPEVGNLTNLETLYLAGPWWVDHGRVRGVGGHIPPELGNLANLEELTVIGQPEYRRRIPPELGNLTNLRVLNLQVGIIGPVPHELGNLASLETLILYSYGADRTSGLSGHIPPALGNLAKLQTLVLTGNLSGAVPPELRNVPGRNRVRLNDNEELCADTMTRVWLEDRFGPDGSDTVPPGGGVAPCDDALAGAYLMQAVQSRESPVPLVAGEDALLRVFTLSAPVVARFYLDGAEAHVADIPRFHFDGGGESQGDGEDLAAAAMIPGSVVQPGLEMVVEGGGRIPTERRIAIDVREMPTFNLTLVPVCYEGFDDACRWRESIADSMATDPDHWRLRYTADLLPVGEMRVTAHATIEIDTASQYPILSAVSAARALEGGTGHWMGIARGWVAGRAWAPGWVSWANGAPNVVAHELGHNFSLRHAPCGAVSYSDPHYPYPDGSIGNEGLVKGFAVRDVTGVRQWLNRPDEHYYWTARQLVGSFERDLMSYCDPEWISDYSFKKALEYRLLTEDDRPAASTATARDPVRSLLLWGGADSTGTPYLEPVFVVDALPSLPDARGLWTLEGRDASGSVLFSLPFAMPTITDAGEGAGAFAFVLPVGSGWEALARVKLSGPGGTATLGTDTDRPVSIWRDEDGQVRAILRGDPASSVGAAPTPPRGLAGAWLTFSPGIPAQDAWRVKGANEP